MKDLEIISSTEIYSGRVIDLSVERILLPGGRETTREVVRHPGAAAIVPMISSDEIVLIRQLRYCAGKVLWEIPAGTIEPGETPEDCAGRELAEETGYRAASLEHMGSFYTSPGFCNELLHLYLATGLEECDSRLETDELLEVHTMSLASAFEKLECGEIIDAKTIVGIMKVRRMGRKPTT